MAIVGRGADVGTCSLSHGERVGVRGYGARRSAGTPSNLITPHPPAAAQRAPPSPYGRGVNFRLGSQAGARLSLLALPSRRC
nr:hypothetical protein [Caulobacter sp. BE254]